jgi:hypothetical protein
MYEDGIMQYLVRRISIAFEIQVTTRDEIDGDLVRLSTFIDWVFISMSVCNCTTRIQGC